MTGANNRILIIEDDPEFRSLGREVLAQSRILSAWEVLAPETLEEALKIAKDVNQRVKIALVDKALNSNEYQPERNDGSGDYEDYRGWQVASHLREVRPDIKLVSFSKNGALEMHDFVDASFGLKTSLEGSTAENRNARRKLRSIVGRMAKDIEKEGEKWQN